MQEAISPEKRGLQLRFGGRAHKLQRDETFTKLFRKVRDAYRLRIELFPQSKAVFRHHRQFLEFERGETGKTFQPMCRKPSTMFIREAWYAGTSALISPTKAATIMAISPMDMVTFMDAGNPGRGDLPIRYMTVAPSKTPATPPMTANVTDSAR